VFFENSVNTNLQLNSNLFQSAQLIWVSGEVGKTSSGCGSPGLVFKKITKCFMEYQNKKCLHSKENK
jgi:hypothetical protein